MSRKAVRIEKKQRRRETNFLKSVAERGIMSAASLCNSVDFWTAISDLNEYRANEEGLVEPDFQRQMEEYLNNADEIPFLTLPDVVTVLRGICKLCEACEAITL